MSFREVYGAGQRVPIRLWSRRADAATLRQLTKLASSPHVVEAVAAMPDAHVGAGVAVGTVFATEHTVMPRALGGDLGCGMSACRLGVSRPPREVLERILVLLDRNVPSGPRLQRSPVPVPDELLAWRLSTRALERARAGLLGRHLGTLGGGNHFLEIDVDGKGELWLLVHSGSRGLGAAVAHHHTQVQAPMDVREDAGRAYLSDQQWALAVARENRRRIQSQALDALASVLGELRASEEFDVHHNFVAQETWGERSLLVHRKGAVSAPAGAPVLIPGSMGTATYVARGLGCVASFASCSHGAGRVLSRGDAHRTIRSDAFNRSMRHVVYPQDRRHLVEEAPAAYRDLDEVMDDQADLVRRQVHLRPVLVLKG